MINEKVIIDALKEIGIEETDSVFVHSSLKSFGWVDGGAKTVISALQRCVAKGTLLMPAFCQKHFAYAYTTWDLQNSPSDVGVITECFRKKSGVLRSNQATHSVCAFGENAKYFTMTHTEGRGRIGVYGDTPFSYSSPFEKMYHAGAKVVFLGCGFEVNTFSHLVEYKIVNDVIDAISDEIKKKQAVEEILTFEDLVPFRLKKGDIPQNKCWLNICRENIQQFMEERGMLRTALCGNAKIISFLVRDYVDLQYYEVVNNPELWLDGQAAAWFYKYSSFYEEI